MQLHELEAWLGDDHGLSDSEMADLLAQAADIAARYPDKDDAAERDQALTAAYRLMAEPAEDVLADFAKQRADARAAEAAAIAGLQHAVRTLVTPGKFSEAGVARAANVDRMTVRKWLGK